MRMIILSSLVAVCIAVISYYFMDSNAISTASALSGNSVRI